MLFKIMGEKGDAAIDYDYEVAEEKFTELVEERNLIPFAREPGKPMKRINELTPHTAEVIFFPKLAGG